MLALVQRGAVKSKTGKTVPKTHLPEKPCLVCGRPMIWRKRWARDWDQVKTCSQRCRRAKGGAPAREVTG
jgi:hypothetical protein